MPNSMTSPLTATGRTLFALAILGFGIQYAIYGQLREGLPMFPAWIPGEQIIAYAMAAILIAATLALLAAFRVDITSLALGILLLAVSSLYLGHLQYTLHDGRGRTHFLQALSFASASLVLHALATGLASKCSLIPCRILFAFAMIVFGAQHFMYTTFISDIVPAWIPQHYFWVIFTGIALIVAGGAIATTVADKAASPVPLCAVSELASPTARDTHPARSTQCRRVVERLRRPLPLQSIPAGRGRVRQPHIPGA
jgi:uncharacterized membrane protein